MGARGDGTAAGAAMTWRRPMRRRRVQACTPREAACAAHGQRGGLQELLVVEIVSCERQVQRWLMDRGATGASWSWRLQAVGVRARLDPKFFWFWVLEHFRLYLVISI